MEHNDNSKMIKDAVKILERGGLLVAPSDTVYGLLVDATNPAAVKKLVEFKNRPAGKAISVFVADVNMLQEEAEISDKQAKTIKELFPGPFTIILKSKHKVSRLLESEKGNLGVRIPRYRFINELVEQFGKPITATSANLSGRSPHYSVQSLLNELTGKKKELIDLVIDAGELPRNKPSTVIDLTGDSLKVIRQGDFVFKDIKTFISNSPIQTRKIAQYILKKENLTSLQRPLIFIIQGDLGVGKTVFVKGLGEYLGIRNIISPTYTVYYEYVLIKRLIETFVHIDLYNIQDKEEFKYLGLEKYLKKRNLLCFEWGEKAGEILNLLKKKGKIVYVMMKYINEKNREIQVNF